MFRIYTGGGCPVNRTSAYHRTANTAGSLPVEQRYDQVQFSTQLDQTSRRVKETVGSLSQEIRARVTTQDVERLRQQVADGQYQPTPREIAARMLLRREDG